ncbi:MAG: hypothetical protein Q8O55_01655 [Dehalococcoidales bacterium]|nr:hypothetical protein [Dehalococcoidales bacterium]
MARRIIGQCNTTDFKALEHLISLVRQGEEVYQDNLSGRQKTAVMVLRHFQMCGVPFEVILKLREVLVWEMPDKGLAFEYKMLNPQDIETQTILWAMAPRKLTLLPGLMKRR